MTEEEQRRKMVMDAEEAILGLKEKMAKHGTAADTLGIAKKDFENANARFDATMSEMRGMVRQVEGKFSRLAESSQSTSDAIRVKISQETDAIRKTVTESVEKLDAGVTRFAASAADTVAAARTTLEQQQAATASIVADVRTAATVSREQVTETYSDARSRFERGRDEFVDARKEMISAATELRASMLRLEAAEGEFRSAVSGSVRRIERVVYMGVTVSLVALGAVVFVLALGR